MMGTYGGYQSRRGANSEPSYAIEGITNKGNVVVLEKPEQVTEFRAGDVVGLESAQRIESGIYPVYSMLNEVVEGGQKGLRLKHPVLDAYNSVAGRRARIYRLNTGQCESILVGSSLHPESAEVYRDIVVRNLKLEQTRDDDFYVIKLSSMYALIDNIIIIGSGGIAGNPFAFSTIRNCHIYYKKIGIELAYWSNNVVVEKNTLERIADVGSNWQFAINVSTEGGNDCSLNENTILEKNASSSKQASLALNKQRTVAKNNIVMGSPEGGVGIAVAGDHSVLEGNVVIAPNSHGININAEGVQCIGNTVSGLAGQEKFAIRLGKKSTNCVVQDNNLGDVTDVRGLEKSYEVADEGRANRIQKNSKFSIQLDERRLPRSSLPRAK